MRTHTRTTPIVAPPARRLLAGALPLALALTLAGCGDDAGTEAGGSGGQATEHNEADVAFAQGMIPHHEQAVEMARLALRSAEDPEVVALAEDVEAAQEPEIATMRAMLEAWGEEAPDEMAGMDMAEDSGDGAAMDGMGMEGLAMDSMPGMMSAEEMEALAEAEGAEFDQLWLSMMIEHHEGAVEMAGTAVDEGENEQAQDLAEDIVEAQQAEIEQMQGLLED